MNREIQNLLFTIRDDTSRFKYDYGFEDDNKILIKAKIGDWIMLLEEIERLNKSLEEQRHFYLNQLQQKENIIKEVREYIEEKYDYILGDDTFLDHDERIERKQIKHILDILKGNDKE